MANDISSMFLVKTTRPANDSSQLVRPETTGKIEDSGQPLPDAGKGLPQSADTQQLFKLEINEAVEQINNYVQSVNRELSFSIDESTERTIIKVIDSDSGELIRQIPSEEVLALASSLQEYTEDFATARNIPQGILFSDKT